MKKLVVTSILAGALAMSVFGQGVVVFNNNSATLVTYSDDAKAALGTTAAGPTGTAFLAELYYAPNGPDPGDQGMLQGQMGLPRQFSGLSAGTFSGGSRTTPTTTAPATPAWFQVRVWEAAYGATYEEAVGRSQGGRGAIAGQSNRFNLTTGTSLVPAPIAVPGGVEGFIITVVPEPSTFALGLLGLAGLFILRRRNS